MPKIKHTARKNSAGSSARAPPGEGSDDSDGPRRPFKRVARRPPPELHSLSDGSDFEDELAAEERVEHVAARKTMPKPGTRRPSYMSPPPPEQPEGEARRISLEPPPTLGREVKDFTKVPKSSYFTFRRDVNQFSVERDSMDSRFHTHVQADIFSTVIVPKGLSVHHYIDLEHIPLTWRNTWVPLSSLSHRGSLPPLLFGAILTVALFINFMPRVSLAQTTLFAG